MTRNILFATVAAAATLALSLGARADDSAQTVGPAPSPAVSDGLLSIAQVALGLEAQGYVVREIERKRGYYEAYLITPAGHWIEVYLDPATGKTTHWEHDDDRYDDRHHGRYGDYDYDDYD